MAENQDHLQVAPAPLPTDIQLAQIRLGDGTLAVRIVASTPGGVGFYFLPGEAAVDLGRQLQRLGESTKAGLIMPSQNGN